MSLLLFADPFSGSSTSPLEDLFQSLVIPRFYQCPARSLRNLQQQLSQIEKDESISVDKDHFQAIVDVQQFKPEEISVKVTGEREVTIEGKHEEKQDEHGYISRHFVRRYVLPEDVDVKGIRSKLSSDGVLSITAPKIEQGRQVEQREIPVVQTGQPVKRLEQKEEQPQGQAQNGP